MPTPPGSWRWCPWQEGPDGTCTPLPADGVQLTVAASILGRDGSLLDHVLEARRWLDGRWEPFDRQDLRRDPLLASSLEQDFVAGRVQADPPTTRVIGGRELLCDQFTLAAADTQVAALPAGRMIQVTSREIAVAVHPEVPFLGLAYAAERVRAESSLGSPQQPPAAPAAPGAGGGHGAGGLRHRGQGGPRPARLT